MSIQKYQIIEQKYGPIEELAEISIDHMCLINELHKFKDYFIEKEFQELDDTRIKLLHLPDKNESRDTLFYFSTSDFELYLFVRLNVKNHLATLYTLKLAYYLKQLDVNNLDCKEIVDLIMNNETLKEIHNNIDIAVIKILDSINIYSLGYNVLMQMENDCSLLKGSSSLVHKNKPVLFSAMKDEILSLNIFHKSFSKLCVDSSKGKLGTKKIEDILIEANKLDFEDTQKYKNSQFEPIFNIEDNKKSPQTIFEIRF
jgi:hypothetical protein